MNIGKKIAFLGLLFCFAALHSNAQFKAGVRVGLNFTSFSAEEFRNNDYSITVFDEAIVGFHGGLMGKFTHDNFYFQPELLYTSLVKDFKIKDLKDPNLDDIIKRQTIGRLDLPLLAGVKVGMLKLSAGPLISLVLHQDDPVNDAINYEQSFKRLQYGYQLGTGLDIMNISLDLRYEGMFGNYNQSVVSGGQSFEWKTKVSQIVIGIGLVF